MLKPILVTPPARLPVSLAEAKAHCRVDHDDENVRIEAMIATAASFMDGWHGVLGLCMVTQVWREVCADWPGDGLMPLRLTPASATPAPVIRYYDADNALQTVPALSVTGPFAAAQCTYAKINSAWARPVLFDRPDAVQVDYTAGFGAPQDVPISIRQALLMLVADMFENRATKVDARMVENSTFRQLLMPWRPLVSVL